MEQMEAAVLCLEGDALLWEHRHRPIQSWVELKALLLRRFRPSHEGSVYERFLSLKQKSIVEEYRKQFELLASSLGHVAEPLLESTFLKDLKHEILRPLRMLDPAGL